MENNTLSISRGFFSRDREEVRGYLEEVGGYFSLKEERNGRLDHELVGFNGLRGR